MACRDNHRMDRPTARRAALLQAGSVVALSLLLAVTVPESAFEKWGWLVGPAAWAACALFTAARLDLPRGPVLLGAALAGIPSVLAVMVGAHWLGAALAVIAFAAWCGVLAEREGEPRAAG